jgi:hypothetical protein
VRCFIWYPELVIINANVICDFTRACANAHPRPVPVPGTARRMHGPRATRRGSLARYLLLRISSSRPENADSTLDCSWRKLAYEYAPSLQPLTTARAEELHDALELSSLFNETFAAPGHHPSASLPSHDTPITVFVSTDGRDEATGTEVARMLTLQAAVREMRAGGQRGLSATIYLRQGSYLFNETLVLTSLDSQLVIASYPGKSATSSFSTPPAACARPPCDPECSNVPVSR